MATNTAFCGICDLRHLSVPSTDWCPECEEALCSTCKEHHSLSKSSRTHKTIPIADYQKLPPFVSEIYQHCREHNDKYHLFCQTHDQPLCSYCIKTHGKCDKIVPLKEVLENAKTSDLLQDLKQSLVDLIENIKRMKKDRKENLVSIKDEKEKWIDEIRNVRRQINQHLDKLEEQMIKELETVEETTTVKIQGILDSLDDKEKEITRCQTVVDNIEHYASDLQIFLGTRETESKITDSEKVVQAFVENKSLDQSTVSCSFDTKIQDILTDVKKFGSVKIQTSPTQFILNRRKNKQAQIFLAAKRQSIDEIKPQLIKTINTGGRAIRGCSITPNGGLLFTDHYGGEEKMIAVNADGSSNFTLQLPQYSAYDVTIIDDQTIAVTSGDFRKRGVSIINLTGRQVTNFISLPGKPYGITYNGKALICSVEEQNIHLISVTDYNITTLANSKLPSFSYVAVHADKIYYTSHLQNTVTCCLLDGTTVWQFKNDTILKGPHGVTVDNNGNVYVAGDTHNVVIISPDGKQHKQILGFSDGLFNPSALFFDKLNSRLLVANCFGKAFLFSIS